MRSATLTSEDIACFEYTIQICCGEEMVKCVFDNKVN